MRVFFFTKAPFLSRFPLNVIQQVKVSIVLRIMHGMTVSCKTRRTGLIAWTWIHACFL